MPPVIQTPLPAIAFSKNPIWLKLQSDDFLAVAPATSVCYLEFTGVVAPGDTNTLLWTGGAASMTAAAVPNDTGRQYPSGAGDWAYVQSLVPYFQGNLFIDRDYIVTASNAGGHLRLIFTARVKSADYDFQVGANIGVITPGGSDQPKTNFRHHVQLWIQNETATGYLVALPGTNYPLDVPTAGLSSADIHNALHAFLSSDVPELTALTKRCLGSIRACFVKYAQYYGDPASVQRLRQSAVFYINKGGLSTQASAERDIYGELCIDPGDTTTWKLLRLGSKNKLIRTDQPEWLTWLNLTGAAQNVQLEIKIYNTDASVTTFTTSGAIAAAVGSKYQFQTGFSQLGITGRQAIGKTPIYYTARVKGADGYLSATYAYVIYNNYQEWPRYFVYENSYGGFQTIRTTGKGSSGFEWTKEDAQLAVDRGTAAVSGEFLEINITWRDKFTVNYGYDQAGKRNLDLLRDFFASRSRYLFSAGKLIPIGIGTKEGKDAPDGVNVYASSFDYYPLYENEQFTEDPALVDDTIPDLLIDAGQPVPVTDPTDPEPPVELVDGTIILEYADAHITVVDDRQRVSVPLWLTGKTNYRIAATQMGDDWSMFKTGDIAYNAAGGYFDVMIPGWRLAVGEQLIIWPFIINPDLI